MAPKFRRRSQCACIQGCYDADFTSGNECTFFFVEYFDLWVKQVNIEATVDQRSLWLETKQTLARDVRYIYDRLILK